MNHKELKGQELTDEKFPTPYKEALIRQLLEGIGEDSCREGLIDTPKRVVKSFDKLYGGYKQKPQDVLTFFESEDDSQIILLKNIEVYSMCEHHMLPFFGKAHIAYLPNKRIVGISKLARLLEVFARRLQIQERIGEQVTKSLMELLDAQGAACIIEAQHTCMLMRGVEKQNSVMTTSSMKGKFLTDNALRQELLTLISL